MAVTSAGAEQAKLLPRSVSTDIWKVAAATALIPRLARSTPLILGENVFPTVTKRPAASIIAESQAKRASDFEIGSKTVKPVKAVVMTEFPLEIVLTNPASIIDTIATESADAIARQIDLAIIHNRDALTGASLSADNEYLNKTTQRIEVGAEPVSTKAEIKSAAALVRQARFSPNGLALDPLFQTRMIDAVYPNTNTEVFPNLSLSNDITNVLGLPAGVSETVSGAVDGSAATTLRGIAGDFSSLRWGRVLDIRTKKVEYGDPTGNGDLQARNHVAYITEAFFGWTVMDSKAFVALDDAVA